LGDETLGHRPNAITRHSEHPEPDPSISTYLDSLRDPSKLSLPKLKRDHVEAVDAASGIARRRWPVYACLVYDTRLDGQLFVLSGKQWFRISESFDQEIIEFVEGLPETDLALPAAPPEDHRGRLQRPCR
jgi:uncharacterized protein (TIGR04141 family)